MSQSQRFRSGWCFGRIEVAVVVEEPLFMIFRRKYVQAVEISTVFRVELLVSLRLLKLS